MKHNRKYWIGILQIFLASLFFGSYGVWSRFMWNDFAPFFQWWTRWLIIIIILFPFVWKELKIKWIQKKDLKWLWVFFVFTALTQAPLYYAFNHMDIWLASLIFFVVMLLMMNIFGMMFLEEKMNWKKILTLILWIIGLYFVFDVSLVSFLVLALFMAVLWGIASGGELASSKKLSWNYTPLYVSFLSWVIILITNLPVSLALWENWTSFSLLWARWYQMIYSLVSLFGFWLAISWFKKVESSVGSVVWLMEVVFGVLFWLFIFGEQLGIYAYLGMVFILLAAVLQSISWKKNS